MLYDPIAPTSTVKLGGEDRELVFDMNTFSAYEEATGKFFFETLERVVNELQKIQQEGSMINPMRLLKILPVTDIQTLAWAAYHTYERGSDEPIWPLTRSQVGRMINISNAGNVLMAIITGQMRNQPTEEDRVAAGESVGEAAKLELVDSPVKVAPLTGEGGGTDSGL